MKKCSVFVGALLFVSLFVAGEVFAYNYSYSPSFVRTQSRAASGDVDAAYYNPVGTVKLQDGLYIDLGNQMGYKVYSFRPVHEFRTYADKTPAFTIPNLAIVYKKGAGAIHAALYIPGGGGSVNYSAPVGGMSTISYALDPVTWARVNAGFTLPVTGTLGVNYLKGSSFWMQGQAGGAFKVNDLLSVTAGVKVAKYQGFQSAGVLKLGTVKKNEYSAMGMCGFAGFMISPTKSLDITAVYNTVTVARGYNKDVKNGWRTAYEARLDDYVLVGIGFKPTEKMSMSVSYQLTLQQQHKLGSGVNMLAKSLELGYMDQAIANTSFATVLATPGLQTTGNVLNYKKKLGHMIGAGMELDTGKVILSCGAQLALQDIYNKVQNPADPNLTKIGVGAGFKFKATETVALEAALARYFYITDRMMMSLIKMNKEVWSGGIGISIKAM